MSDYPNETQRFYYEELKWCGCGNPEDALAFMRDVLIILKSRSDENRAGGDSWGVFSKSLDEKLPDALGLSYLYALDALGLTEHGGSIYGCWLTPKGKEVLSILSGDIEADMTADYH